MRRVTVNLNDSNLTINPEGKSFTRKDLKGIAKWTTKNIGPETADTLVKFLQVWNETEPNLVHPHSSDVSKRTPDELVSGDQWGKVRVRKRRRRRRKAD